MPAQIRLGASISDACAFTPPPPGIVLLSAEGLCFVGVSARRGWHRWNNVTFDVQPQSVRIDVDLEGHTPVNRAASHVKLILLKQRDGEDAWSLYRRGVRAMWPAAYRSPAQQLPEWWSRPIYCGWGDQVALSLHLEGPGSEFRALTYCTQGLYERWLARLEEAEVPIGTVIIDAGWSPGGVWSPDLDRWPDLRGFIDRQHAKGRKVLLWVATWLREGLPQKWCLRSGNRSLVANAAHPEYRAFLRRSVRKLLSPDGYDADGFKIDQLSFIPSERTAAGGEQVGRGYNLVADHLPIRGSDVWGLELLRLHQNDIYRAAKLAKPDCLVTSSTLHPYFHDTFDMVRLHDTGIVKDVDVFAAMKARADLSRSVLPNHPIDADDWITEDYRRWRAYTLQSGTLGVPCVFYSERFVLQFEQQPVTQPIPLEDLQRITQAWRCDLTSNTNPL